MSAIDVALAAPVARHTVALTARPWAKTWDAPAIGTLEVESGLLTADETLRPRYRLDVIAALPTPAIWAALDPRAGVALELAATWHTAAGVEIPGASGLFRFVLVEARQTRTADGNDAVHLIGESVECLSDGVPIHFSYYYHPAWSRTAGGWILEVNEPGWSDDNESYDSAVYNPLWIESSPPAGGSDTIPANYLPPRSATLWSIYDTITAYEGLEWFGSRNGGLILRRRPNTLSAFAPGLPTLDLDVAGLVMDDTARTLDEYANAARVIYSDGSVATDQYQPSAPPRIWRFLNFDVASPILGAPAGQSLDTLRRSSRRGDTRNIQARARWDLDTGAGAASTAGRYVIKALSFDLLTGLGTYQLRGEYDVPVVIDDLAGLTIDDLTPWTIDQLVEARPSDLI